MPRLLLLTIVVWLALITLSGAVVTIGRAQSVPDMLSRYEVTRCGDSLCFRGMKPGVTTWHDVQTASGREYKPDDPYRLYFPLEDGGIATLSTTFSPEKVFSIHLQLSQNEHRPTVGAILAKFGPPCGVLTSDGTFQSTEDVGLVYPFFDFSSMGLDLNGPITDIYSTSTNQCALAAPSTSFSFIPWLGLRSVSSYKVHVPINYQP